MSAQRTYRLPLTVYRSPLTDLRLVRGLYPELLAGPEVYVLAALDDHSSDTNRRTYSGTDRRSYRTSGNSSDAGSSSCSGTDFRCIRLQRALAKGGAFRVDTLNIVAFDGEDFRHDRVEIAPTRFGNDDAVERQKHRRALLDAARLLDLVDASLDDRTDDLMRGDDLRR